MKSVYYISYELYKKDHLKGLSIEPDQNYLRLCYVFV